MRSDLLEAFLARNRTCRAPRSFSVIFVLAPKTNGRPIAGSRGGRPLLAHLADAPSPARATAAASPLHRCTGQHDALPIASYVGRIGLPQRRPRDRPDPISGHLVHRLQPQTQRVHASARSSVFQVRFLFPICFQVRSFSLTEDRHFSTHPKDCSSRPEKGAVWGAPKPN